MKFGILLSIALVAGLWSCAGDRLTYNQDVAPIVNRNCMPCHRDGGAAPFSLANYRQVYRKRSTIVKVTQSGLMPPWPADRSYRHFLGEKFLTDQEKEILKRWVAQGGAEGSGEPPPAPHFSRVSQIGEPDTTFWFDSIFIEGTNRDQFYIVTLPIELPANTFVRGMEFVPNEHKLVHHMNGHLLNYEEGRKRSVQHGLRWMDIEQDEASYLRQFDSLALYNDDGTRPLKIHSAVNYLPGVEAAIYPEGIGGYTVNRKAILVANDMHYAPIPKGLWDRSHVNLFYSKRPPERPLRETMMGTNGISPIIPPLRVPPNTVTQHRSVLQIDQDISLLTVNPHMHLLGKSFKAYATTPSGEEIPIISIPKWDFRWQYFYTFPYMLKIPKGSVITVEAEFDNSSANPNNPNNPPKEVGERLDRGGEGMRTTDEMLQFILTWLPYEEGDEQISLQVDL